MLEVGCILVMESVSYSAAIRLLDGSPAELLSNEHLLYIAQVMSDKMKAIAQRAHVTYPRSMGVWALGNACILLRACSGQIHSMVFQQS
jgi:hypothetical protein